MAFIKDFFQKMFPHSRREFTAQDTNENNSTNINALEISNDPTETIKNNSTNIGAVEISIANNGRNIGAVEISTNPSETIENNQTNVSALSIELSETIENNRTNIDAVEISTDPSDTTENNSTNIGAVEISIDPSETIENNSTNIGAVEISTNPSETIENNQTNVSALSIELSETIENNRTNIDAVEISTDPSDTTENNSTNIGAVEISIDPSETIENNSTNIGAVEISTNPSETIENNQTNVSALSIEASESIENNRTNIDAVEISTDSSDTTENNSTNIGAVEISIAHNRTNIGGVEISIDPSETIENNQTNVSALSIEPSETIENNSTNIGAVEISIANNRTNIGAVEISIDPSETIENNQTNVSALSIEPSETIENNSKNIGAVEISIAHNRTNIGAVEISIYPSEMIENNKTNIGVVEKSFEPLESIENNRTNIDALEISIDPSHTSEINSTNIGAIEISIDPLETITELNTIVSKNEVYRGQNDTPAVLVDGNVFHDRESNKTLYILQTVAPVTTNTTNTIEDLKVIKILGELMPKDIKATAIINDFNDNTWPNRRRSSNKPEEIKDIYDEFSNDLAFYTDTIFKTEVSELIDVDETLQNLNPNTKPEGTEVVSNVISEDAEKSTGKKIMADETLHTFNMFNSEASTTNDRTVDIVNLDEFYDIFDKVDTVNNELSSNDKSPIDNAVKEITNKNGNCFESYEKIHENFDMISISSSNEGNVEVIQQAVLKISSADNEHTQNSDCDGYNSSDFEFISEAEACMDGFIINFNRDNYNQDIEPSHCSEQVEEENKVYVMNVAELDLGEGPSNSNKRKHLFEDRGYRNNHRIPDGDQYLGLFQGIYNPMMPACNIIYLENKSVRTSAMNVQYDGIGFDKQLALKGHQPDSSEEEYEDEAKASAKKILDMYPGENRKRRRRH